MRAVAVHVRVRGDATIAVPEIGDLARRLGLERICELGVQRVQPEESADAEENHDERVTNEKDRRAS